MDSFEMNDDFPLEEPDDDNADSGNRSARGKGSSASAPVGDIALKKAPKTFNTYRLELSMGQIVAIKQALEKDHANPVSDELLKLFSYYIETVPGPGEEEEDRKAREEHAELEGADEDGDDDDFPIPMPPGYKGDGRVTVAGEGEDEDFSVEDDEDMEEEAVGPLNALLGKSGRSARNSDSDGADRRLPTPPRE